MIHFSKWFTIAIVNFFVAAIMGATMRLAFVTELGWMEFMNVLHAHSHIAMLGWLYVAITLLLVRYFLEPHHRSPHYKYVFLLTQVSVIGMAISFPIQGYGAFSIAFSTLHVLTSYAFVRIFLRDLSKAKKDPTPSLLLVKTSLLFMVISTLALFAMPPIIILGHRSSSLYYMAVQFFLHFQFNGWYIFAILGLFFKLLEYWDIQFPKRQVRIFYWLLVISCILTYALAITWSNPATSLFFVNSLGVIIQLSALIVLLVMIKSQYAQIKPRVYRISRLLFVLSIASFSLKIIVQSAVVIPYIAKIGYTIRNYVVGFIHLILLGVVTFAIFGLAFNIGLLSYKNRTVISGIKILAIGVILSELVLFVQGTLLWGAEGFMPYYYELILAVSLLMPIGIGKLLFSTVRSTV